MSILNVILPIFLVIFMGYLLKITIVLFSCPTAVVTYIMASELGGDPELSSSIVMLSTLMAMVTIPLWVWFVGI